MTRPAASALTRLTILPLLLLAGVNVWLVVGFWGGLGGEDALPYQLFGGCLALIELTFLVVAADAESRGEAAKARTWRAVFFAVLAVNLIADFGAIAAKTSADRAARLSAVAAYEAAEQRQQELVAERDRLSVALDRSALNLPVPALEARARGLAERRQRFEAQGLRPPRALVVEIASVNEAVETARRIAVLDEHLGQVRAELAAFGSRPETSNAQIRAIVTLAATFGLNLDPERVRVGLAAGLALVAKLVLVFGFWAVTPRQRRMPVSPHPEPPKEGLESDDVRSEAARPLPPRPEAARRRSAFQSAPDDDHEAALAELEREFR